MAGPGSVTRWIAALKVGDTSAAAPLWKRYYRHMVLVARKMLRTERPRAADEEDIVQNAFHSFFRALTQGRFPDLDNRDGLRRLLLVITANKALKQLKYERCQKRRVAKNEEPTAAARMQLHDEQVLTDAVASQPGPDFEAEEADDFRRLLGTLGDPTLRQVALWKLEGYSNAEIATMLSCSLRTVARKLEAIRVLWACTADQ